ncbi:MAG: DUF6179 domain-containing protein [Lachnospiraceae bacterium]
MRAGEKNNGLMTGENHNGLLADLTFSESEQEKFIAGLWELLKAQAGKYNGIDSTSMTVEKAQEILESMLYTIGVAAENGAAKEEILNGSLSLLLDRGREILKGKQKSVKVEWKLLCRELPRIPNVYFLSTMENLGLFFDSYDIYFAAHHTSESIDYWPLCPVPETIKGISYIEEYIRRIQIENDFLNCFEREDVISLCEKYVSDYREALFNLCEPVLTNAIGLCLIGKEVRGLHISSAHREDIYHRLIGRTEDEICDMIKEAVLSACRQIGMTAENEKDYLVSAAAGLGARIREALKHRDLSDIFLSFL